MGREAGDVRGADVVGAAVEVVHQVGVHEAEGEPTLAGGFPVSLAVSGHRLLAGVPAATVGLEDQLRLDDREVDEPRQHAPRGQR